MDSRLKQLRYPGCKWNKHLALVDHAELKAYLPKTDLFSSTSFNKFIHSFPVVFLKPRLGGGGHGLYKIVKQGDRYILHYSLYRKIFNNKEALLKVLKRKCGENKYIIQQGLNLLKLSSRLLDFRIVLLKIENKWRFMGIMGKYSARKKFVTNQANGGGTIRFRQAVRQTLRFSEEDCDKLKSKLEAIGLLIAKRLNDTFPNITELGLDIAIDNKQKIWLLEANTRPHFNLFKAHEDSTLYRKITHQAKQLRRMTLEQHSD